MDDLDARGRIIRACAALASASYGEGVSDEQADAWRALAVDARTAVDALIADLRAARAERDEARAVATGLTMLGRYIAREYGQ